MYINIAFTALVNYRVCHDICRNVLLIDINLVLLLTRLVKVCARLVSCIAYLQQLLRSTLVIGDIAQYGSSGTEGAM